MKLKSFTQNTQYKHENKNLFSFDATGTSIDRQFDTASKNIFFFFFFSNGYLFIYQYIRPACNNTFCSMHLSHCIYNVGHKQ